MPAVEPDRVSCETSQTESPVCDHARGLLNHFAESVVGVLKLLEQQFLAVISGDVDANRFDLLIHEANEKKQDAKYAYLYHMQAHGCDMIDESRPS